MDHTHCFTCGRDLDGGVARINWRNDDRLYGLFPGFVPKVRQTDVEVAVDRLRQLDEHFVREIVATIPNDWDVLPKVRDGLAELINLRAKYIVETITMSISKACWPDQLFDIRN